MLHRALVTWHPGNEDVNLSDLCRLWWHGPRCLEGVERVDVRQHDRVALLAGALDAGGREGPQEVQQRGGRLVDDLLAFHSVDVVHCVSSVRAQDVHLCRLRSDQAVLVREKGGDQIETEVHAALGVVGVCHLHEILPGGVDEHALDLLPAGVQWLPHLSKQLSGQELDLGVAAGIRKTGQLLELLREVTRQSSDRALENGAIRERAQDGGDDVHRDWQNVVGHDLRQQLLGSALEPLDSLGLVAAHEACEIALVFQEFADQLAACIQRLRHAVAVALVDRREDLLHNADAS
mmetsp:Transcript_156784/g.500295  ORF Transcript_156784/g.500295 Transcript_156784/m.500295 type:complete len:292 (+) Transcript_156784:3213-4088(+)